MKNIKNFNLFKITLLTLIGLLTFSCQDDDPVFDNSLRVLSQKIDGAAVANGVNGISSTAAIELIFSHTLNTAQLETALSISGGSGGAAGFNLEYTNTNSTITITPSTVLDFETTYTISLASGAYGNQGEMLLENFSLSFTTAAFVPVNVTLSTDVTSISETGEVATVTATLSEVTDQDVSINLNLAGNATDITDYTASNSIITIPAGQLSESITLTANQDSDIEGTEMIDISIDQIINAVELSPQTITVSIIDDDVDTNGDGVSDRGFIINEVLFDPPSDLPGDANGDGTRSASEDEFIEFINDSDQPVDLSNYTLFDARNLETNTPRHTFPPGTIIPPLGVYVLFGGGSPSGDFGNAQVAVSTTGNINLTNGDDVITILDTQGNVFLTFDTQGEGSGINFGADQSVTRSPDINGDFALHTTANASLLYSPGKQASGANFGEAPAPKAGFIINEVLFDPASGTDGDANGDGTRSALDDEFIEFVNDLDVAFDLSGYTVYDATALGDNVPRHTFPPGTIVPPGGVYILFGGGTPTGSFGGAQFDIASGGQINLSNSGDVITILDDLGNVFLTFDTDVEGTGINFGDNQSVTRAPDVTGMFTLHSTANPSLLFSPGTKADGSNF